MKHLSKILIISLLFSLLPLSLVYGNDGAGDQVETTVGSFEIYRDIATRSVFELAMASRVEITADRINKTLGTITLRNNTADGYKVSVTSTNSGEMAPAASDSGESNVPYDLRLEQNGGGGVPPLSYFGDALLVKEESGSCTIQAADYVTASDTTIDFLDTSGLEVMSETDIEWNLKILMTDEHISQFGLSGQYSDTITFTYQDY